MRPTPLLIQLATVLLTSTALFPQELVWPLSSTILPDLPLSSTFGPRLKASAGYRYDFHRGLDIPAAVGTAVYAIADGTVRLAGSYSYYPEGSPLVQLRHERTDGTRYYTNYMHLHDVAVAEGEAVAQGQLIGFVGVSNSGFAHLHFEIRDGGIYQQNCVHPLGLLPYEDTVAQRVVIDSVNASDPLRPIVVATVSLPPTELDLNRVEVRVYDATRKSRPLLDSRSVDFNAWNRAYEDATALDNPDLGGVYIAPARFNAESSRYDVSFRFHDLKGARAIEVEVLASDVHGAAVRARWSSGKPRR